ncbi:hypothetical protein LCGC14_0599670 [marine sediment metagenome]|uniref:UvrD-like helicase C-terminal domain-containing protein n=1 Tax=marine sediment metagenome TaxID=412755 RepID=A0A0F9RUU7_9ZZZZ
MKWSPQQLKAMDMVHRWLQGQYSDQQIFRMFGYAGTGKTTLARHLAEGAGRVVFCTYTGKAASVMSAKGSPCSTIHSLIYMPSSRSRLKLLELQDELEQTHEDDPEIEKLKVAIKDEQEKLKRPSFILNPDSEIQHADLIVVDEVSMVDQWVGRDLESFGVKILVLGDPAQLPPVKGSGYFTDVEPDIMLTEIHRQAAGNPIIELATKVRLGEDLRAGQYGDSRVVDGKPDQEWVMNADQILVGKNLTRRQVNLQMRRLLGRGEDLLPSTGDKVVCLRNDREMGLLNGTLWEVTDTELVDGMELMSLSVQADGNVVTVTAHTHYFKGIEDQLAYYEIREAQCFDFGYALTVHKSQGSQWPDVFIFDESQIFRQHATRWLYTAVTRAVDKVIICRK